MSGRGRSAVIAFGASSALGEGDLALGVGAPGDPAPSAIARDGELEGARLERPFCARVGAIDTDALGGIDRATLLFERALAACAAQLDVALPGWRNKRVGL